MIGFYLKRLTGKADQSGKTDADEARAFIECLTDGPSGPHDGHNIDEMQTTMIRKVGIYRDEMDMPAAVDDMPALRQRCRSVRVLDTGKPFNTDLLGIIERANLLDLPLLTAASALNRSSMRCGPNSVGLVVSVQKHLSVIGVVRFHIGMAVEDAGTGVPAQHGILVVRVAAR